MQNKANLLDAQMNVNSILTKDYERNDIFAVRKNKANSNPIKPNLRNAKMNVNSLITKDYRKKDDFAVRKNKPNSNPISVKPKMNVTTFLTKEYENISNCSLAENKPNTNPIKPNFKRYLAKMGHHELKYIDRLGQLTLNLFIKVNTQASSAERT